MESGISSSPKGFRSRLGSIFKSNKPTEGRKLSKDAPPELSFRKLSVGDTRLARTTTSVSHASKATSGRASRTSSTWEDDEEQFPMTLEGHREKYRNRNVDTQLGESLDHTALLHGLAHRESFDSYEHRRSTSEERPPGERIVKLLSGDIWQSIIDYLTPCDAANLTISSKIMLQQIGYKPWSRLDRPENKQYRVEFLLPMDGYLPMHLFCFPCATYHFRIQPGNERLKPPDVLNPVIDCPNIRIPSMRPPRLRMTPKRTLPFTFLQLACRAQKYGPDYGIPFTALQKRWQEDEWTHLSRFHIHKNGHLLMRITSYRFAPPNLPPAGQRMLLYSRDDYSPYFSACAHWRDGDLMKLCKCALSHIPAPRDTQGPKAMAQRVGGKYLDDRPYNPNAIVTLCGDCQPMRRCPECPSEYLIELRLMEDKADKSFKRAIVITRWADLGTESMSAEWHACMGNDTVRRYDSFAEIGKRAISGIFESSYTDDHIPGQRILSLNPKKDRRDSARPIVGGSVHPFVNGSSVSGADEIMEAGILSDMLASWPTELPSAIHGYKRAKKFSV